MELIWSQLKSSRSEVHLLQEQNNNLQSTLSKLDVLSQKTSNDISMSGEYPSGFPGISHLSSTLGSGDFLKSIDAQQSTQIHEGILQLQRHLGKYRHRAKMFEELSNIFRSAYVSCTTTQASRASSQDVSPITFSFPYGRVVEAIQKSYEDSTSLLEEQIESCLGVIRQNNSYMMELRTRLEDTLHALYRYAFVFYAPLSPLKINMIAGMLMMVPTVAAFCLPNGSTLNYFRKA